MNPTPDTPKPTWLLITVLVVSLLLSLGCLVRLWRRRENGFQLIFWGILIWFPVLGPILFAALFQVPSEKFVEAQASRSQGDIFLVP